MKPVDQSHIRAASLVTERDCIGPNWSRLWALFLFRPLSWLTSEIVSCNAARTRRAPETLRNRFNLPVEGSQPPPKKSHFARCSSGEAASIVWQRPLFAVKLLVPLNKIEGEIFDPWFHHPHLNTMLRVCRTSTSKANLFDVRRGVLQSRRICITPIGESNFHRWFTRSKVSFVTIWVRVSVIFLCEIS